MFNLRVVASLFSAGVGIVGGSVAWSQDYPIKPIRIVTLVAGGSNASEAGSKSAAASAVVRSLYM